MRRSQSVLIFDNHPDSIRLLFGEGVGEPANPGASPRANWWEFILVSMAIMAALIAMFWLILGAAARAVDEEQDLAGRAQARSADAAPAWISFPGIQKRERAALEGGIAKSYRRAMAAITQPNELGV